MHEIASLEGSEVLLVENEYIIALNIATELEREGAAVHHTGNLEKALELANQSSISTGVIDVRLGEESAEPVCDRLVERRIPFIFHTGMFTRAPARFQLAPVVRKPAAPSAIIGALRFALTAPDLVGAVDGHVSGDLPRAIQEGEARVARVRTLLARLEASGLETTAAQDLLDLLMRSLETMRFHARLRSSPPWPPWKL